MGLGQYNSLGEYCDPHTASSVFLILTIIAIYRGLPLITYTPRARGGSSLLYISIAYYMQKGGRGPNSM